MKEAIYGALKPVKGRQQILFTLRSLFTGLLVGAAVGLVLGLARFAFGFALPESVYIGVLAAGPVIGLLCGLILRRGWHEAAEAVDAHYDLKDRTVSALAFISQPTKSDLHSLQMEDTVGHLKTVEAGAVVPFKASRSWTLGVVGTIAAALLMFLPMSQPQAEAGLSPTPDHVLAAVQDTKAKMAELQKKLAETTQDLEDEKSDEEKKGLEELEKKIQEKIEELSQPNLNEREALAKLSEMQAEMQNLANQLNVAALDGQLSSLGNALAASQAFEGAGKALQEGKLEKAAKELEKIDEVKLTPKEAKALEEKLKQLAKKMGEAGQGSLSEAVGELAENLKGGNGKVGKSTKQIAKSVNNAIKRRKANELLNNANEELKDCKCQCQNNGGERVKNPNKSNNPSSTWGRAIAGNIDGEKTKLGSKRNELQVTGTPGGEGDSDVETTSTPEARQLSSREYKEKYDNAKKAMESVVEGEPIPLGHRQMVKRYFESIRPSNADATAPAKSETEQPKK
jgi:hypothetical protein